MTEGWQGILDKGENILWQGRPNGAVVFRPQNVFTLLFGLAFAGFALFWMIMASQAGGFFWMFGLLHFGAGLSIAFGTLFMDAFVRRRTWYTLTDRRAFIATELPLKGRSLTAYPIGADTVFDYSGDGLTSIHFASRRVRTKNGYRDRPIGFDRIAEGETVLRLMRQVQRNAADAPKSLATEPPALHS